MHQTLLSIVFCREKKWWWTLRWALKYILIQLLLMSDYSQRDKIYTTYYKRVSNEYYIINFFNLLIYTNVFPKLSEKLLTPCIYRSVDFHFCHVYKFSNLSIVFTLLTYTKKSLLKSLSICNEFISYPLKFHLSQVSYWTESFKCKLCAYWLLLSMLTSGFYCSTSALSVIS